MSDPTLAARVIDTGQREWSNKHLTYTQAVRGLFDIWNPAAGSPLERYNATTRALLGIVGEALRAGVRVRALGGGWSISRAPATEGWLLNTKPLNLSFEVGGELVHSRYAGDRAGLRFTQCGNSILELNRLLRRQRRSLRATGASNGQTIAGAAATGTHGSVIGGGSVADYVVGMHLLVSPGLHVWLERASAPVLSDAFAARLGAAPVRDDALFDAALVSFGSFGIVHGVAIETDPVFLLEMHRRQMAPDPALRRAFDTLDFTGVALPGAGAAERPHHFQVVVNPYDLARGPYVTAMYRRPFREDYPRPPVDADGFGPGDDAPAFIGLVTDAIPAAVPAVVTNIMGRVYRDVRGQWGTVGEIFGTTSTRGRAAGTAMGVPLERANEALDLLLEVNRRSGPFAALLSLLYARGTRATLGFTRFPVTCVVEIDGPLSGRFEEFARRAWDALAARGIPHTYHWGKILPLDPGRVRAAYGGAVDRWLDARRALLPPESRRVFSSPFTDALGLSA